MIVAGRDIDLDSAISGKKRHKFEVSTGALSLVFGMELVTKTNRRTQTCCNLYNSQNTRRCPE